MQRKPYFAIFVLKMKLHLFAYLEVIYFSQPK